MLKCLCFCVNIKAFTPFNFPFTTVSTRRLKKIPNPTSSFVLNLQSFLRLLQYNMRAIFVKGLSQCTMSSRDIFASLHCKLAVPRFPEYFILGLNGFFVQLHVRLFGGRILTLFSVPEIEQECFHNNRYPTIASVVYITAILPIVHVCLITSRRAVSDPAPRHDAVHCLQCM